MGSIGNTTAPDLFGGTFGTRRNMSDEDKENVLDEIFIHNIVNPNFQENPDTENFQKFHRNCALCTTAAALQLMGYNVEALARDEEWRGPSDVFDIDYNNPDNFIASNGKTLFNGDPVMRTDVNWKAVKDKNGKILRFEKVESKHLEINRQTNGKTTTTRINDVSKVQTMPKGADKASSAIIDKVKGWGNGSFGEITVCWKSGSGHSMLITNVRGHVQIYDTQSGKYYGTNEIKNLLKGTKANTTTIKRLDNAKVKSDYTDVSKMVKKK